MGSNPSVKKYEVLGKKRIERIALLTASTVPHYVCYPWG